MKSILVGRKAPVDQEYPCLKIIKDGKGITVLFSNDSSGTVIHDPSDFYEIGHHCTNWSPNLFEPLQGKITLSN